MHEAIINICDARIIYGVSKIWHIDHFQESTSLTTAETYRGTRGDGFFGSIKDSRVHWESCVWSASMARKRSLCVTIAPGAWGMSRSRIFARASNSRGF